MSNDIQFQVVDDDIKLEIIPHVIELGTQYRLSGADYWNLRAGASGSSNFELAWQYATGQGVTVGLVDQGVNYLHADLSDHYSTEFDFDPRDDEGLWDALPDSIAEHHGTNVAGVIAGDIENDFGTIGAAPDSVLTASYLRYGADFSMAELAEILAQQTAVDVSNNSWGFSQAFADNFLSSQFGAIQQGLAEAASSGREGLGTVFVFAGGNGKLVSNGQNIGDDSNFHNFTNSRYTIAVGAHDADGKAAFFSNPGTNLLLSAPGIGLLTTDGTEAGAQGSSYVSGTSFAAPLVSSAVALMLEANPNLGYRDVQEILAISATPSSGAQALANGAGNVNGGGMIFDREMGFGRLDAAAAVNLARNWTLQSTAHNEESLGLSLGSAMAPDRYSAVMEGTLEAPESGGFSLDRVEVTLTLFDLDLKKLSIALVSPDGTRAVLAENLNAVGNRTSLNFTFSSVVTWGEDPFGTWRLEFTHADGSRSFAVYRADIRFHGDTDSADDTYYYTSAYSGLAAGDEARRHAVDGDGGVDTLNFAAATGAALVDLSRASASSLAGSSILLDGDFERIIGSTYADRLSGSVAANRLVGDFGDDDLLGQGGDDDLAGGAGSDRMAGGSGADRLDGGAGFDTADYSLDAVSGGTGGIIANLSAGAVVDGFGARDLIRNVENVTGSMAADKLVGDALANVFDGRDGSDHLVGFGDDDTLRGGAGNDVIAGGAGADMLDGGAGLDIADFRAAGPGLIVDLTDPQSSAGEALGDTFISVERFLLSGNADTYRGSDAADIVYGGGGDDAIGGRGGLDLLLGEAGNDVLRGEAGDDLLSGGAGADVLDGGAGTDTADFRTAGPGLVVDLANSQNAAGDAVGDTFISIERFFLSGHSDSLSGSGGADIAYGDGGNDVLGGNGGADLLVGGAGNDTLHGGDGRDGLNGGAGDDHLFGGNDADSLFGGEGRDNLQGGEGADCLFGGAGSDVFDDGDGIDVVSYSTATQGIVVDLAKPSLSAGEAAGDTYLAVERFVLTSWADTFVGTGAADWVSGGDGADSLHGGAGADTLVGGRGGDFLLGGAGADTLSGGEGADTFVYAAATDSSVAGGGIDRLVDFSRAQGDKIDFSALSPGAFHYVDAAVFSGIAGEIRAIQAGATQIVQVDLDGNRAADLMLYVAADSVLERGDFIL